MKGMKKTEPAPRQEKGVKKHTFDQDEGGGSRTKKKTTGHIEKLAGQLHGSDPYCHVK